MSEDGAAAATTAASAEAAAVTTEPVSMPICLIVLGMAGSGKTTFVRKLTELSFERYKPYVINIDPACHETPYNANIDIRDSVNYKEVMKQYKLGPNGAIVTSLNLFATKFEKVVQLIRRAGENGHKYCIIDTPGQIEVFTWSASGNIITESLATMFPTIVVYVMDVVRSTSPTTFMSNMLYACSIMFKARLPFIVALNKIDLKDHDYAIEWMTDFTAFQEALQIEKDYITNLTSCMSLTLDEFYKDLKTCGVSSKTGVGFNQFFDLIEKGAIEYESNYRQEYLTLRAKKLNDDSEKEKRKLETLAKNDAPGVEIPLTNNFIEQVSSGRELADIYLTNPGDESSEDEDGNEEEIPTFNADAVEDANFQNFISAHVSHQVDKERKQMQHQQK